MEKPQQNKQTKQGDVTHPNKTTMQSSELHQQAMLDYYRVIPEHYRPP